MKTGYSPSVWQASSLPHSDNSVFKSISEHTMPSSSVLVVDDDESVKVVVASILRDAQYETYEARTGREATQLLQRLNGQVDLLLTDVMMPDLHGVALATGVMSRWPQIKVLYMSGYFDASEVQLFGLHVPDTFIHKPFDSDVLVAKVREALGQEGAGKLVQQSRYTS